MAKLKEFIERFKAVLFYDMKKERWYRCGRKIPMPMSRFGIKIEVEDDVILLEGCGRHIKKNHR